MIDLTPYRFDIFLLMLMVAFGIIAGYFTGALGDFILNPICSLGILLIIATVVATYFCIRSSYIQAFSLLCYLMSYYIGKRMGEVERRLRKND